MKASVLLLLCLSLCTGIARSDQWIGLWTEDDAWYGMKDDGEVWFYNPGTGTPVLVGSFGDGPWVGFSKAASREFLALRASGEIWAMTAFGSTRIFLTMPGDREWCTLLTAPEGGYGPNYALTCNGEIWVASDPPVYAGNFGSSPVPMNPASWGRLKAAFRSSP
jgi:hypothetical protein